MTKEFLRKRIDQQRSYIKSLADKEFSSFERRIEVTNSAMQVLKRLESDLNKKGIRQALKNIGTAAALTALFAIVFYYIMAFISWWDIHPIAFLIYRILVVLWAGFMTKMAIDITLENNKRIN